MSYQTNRTPQTRRHCFLRAAGTPTSAWGGAGACSLSLPRRWREGSGRSARLQLGSCDHTPGEGHGPPEGGFPSLQSQGAASLGDQVRCTPRPLHQYRRAPVATAGEGTGQSPPRRAGRRVLSWWPTRGPRPCPGPAPGAHQQGRVSASRGRPLLQPANTVGEGPVCLSARELPTKLRRKIGVSHLAGKARPHELGCSPHPNTEWAGEKPPGGRGVSNRCDLPAHGSPQDGEPTSYSAQRQPQHRHSCARQGACERHLILINLNLSGHMWLVATILDRASLEKSYVSM